MVRCLFPATLLTTWLLLSATPSDAQKYPKDQDCLDCHSDEGLTKEGSSGEVISLFVDGAVFEHTVHGGLSCADCHSSIAEIPHKDILPKADCSDCHPDVVDAYIAGSHGASSSGGNGGTPNCTSCHGDIHRLAPLDDPRSLTHPARLPETCGYCHSNPEIAAEYGIHVVRPVVAYRDSVHARAVAAGNEGASCNDCHSSHGQLPCYDPLSTVHRTRVTDTCGICHEEIALVYSLSVHGAALARGIQEAPVCTDCHGEHRILPPSEHGSPVHISNMPTQACGRCHNDVRLSEKYGLSLDRIHSYQDSYHGLVARAGGQSVASCASCHGVHDILPSTNPRSNIYRANLAATCGQCHPGAGTRFAIGPVHMVDTDARFPMVYAIRLFYVILIVVTIGGMFLHVFLDFSKKWRSRELRSLALAESSGGERMMRGFRAAHMLVMISFPVLVYTGFALRYHDAWWAHPFIALGPVARGWAHRAAGVVLIAALFYHVVHLVRDRRARTCIANMRPLVKDWRELKERFRYYVGFRKEPVPRSEVGYIEKVEYLSLWWGMLIMALTGFLLWFESFTLSTLPSWVPAAATAIHFYEAVLATLAVLVWHFYWTIFDPAVYPMDMSWWTGKSPASHELERRRSE